MARTKIYNRVVSNCSKDYILGELFTDRELHYRLARTRQEDWPHTIKVEVRMRDVFRSFGVRFAKKWSFVPQQEN